MRILPVTFKDSVEGKDIIPWPGYCPTHEAITVEKLEKLKKEHPAALIDRSS